MSGRLRAGGAGAAAATAWGLLEPVDQRLLRCDYSDIAVLGNSVFVSDLNAGLQVFSFSNPAVPALKLSSFGEFAAIQISGEIGRRYSLQYAPYLPPAPALPASNSWTSLPAFTLTNSPQTIVDTTPNDHQQRFYRARLAE